MIDLTPLEVRQKKGDFRRAVRGYDPELVNDFLDLTADRMEELARDNMALTERVERLESDLRAFRDKERSLSEALMTAQRLRDDARSLAEKESELLIREARSAAESARDEALRMLAREEEALRQVRARRGQLVRSFRRLLEREMTELDVIEETLGLSGAAAPVKAEPEGEPEAAEPTEPVAGPEEPEAGPKEPESPAAASEDDLPEDLSEEEWLSSLVEESRRDGT